MDPIKDSSSSLFASGRDVGEICRRRRVDSFLFLLFVSVYSIFFCFHSIRHSIILFLFFCSSNPSFGIFRNNSELSMGLFEEANG